MAPARKGGSPWRRDAYAPPMLYRILRGVTEIYGVTWLAIFILMFFVAFAFTLIYPLVPIVMIISSVFLVVLVRCGYLGLKWGELAVARGALGSGACPACSTRCDALRVGEQRVLECPACRRVFEDSGEIYTPASSESAPAASFDIGSDGRNEGTEGVDRHA